VSRQDADGAALVGKFDRDNRVVAREQVERAYRRWAARLDDLSWLYCHMAILNARGAAAACKKQR
jgi:hypothetical protein